MPPSPSAPPPAAPATRPTAKKKRRSGPRIRIGPLPAARRSRPSQSAAGAPDAIADFQNAASGNNDLRNNPSGSSASGNNASGNNVRARLQPCRKKPEKTGALAPEGASLSARGVRESSAGPGREPGQPLESPAPAPPPAALDRDREATITVKEAAYRLGKSDDTIYKWLRTGRLRGWQPGGPTCHIQVSEQSVSEALRQAAGTRN